MLKPAFRTPAHGGRARWRPTRADGGPALIVGAPWREGGKLYNAAVLLDGGRVAAARYKHELPNYGVFDEKRVFAAGAARARSPSAACGWASWSARTCGLPTVPRRLAESGAEMLLLDQRLPLRGRTSRTHRIAARGAAGGRDRPADRLSATRSAARTSWCSTARPSCSTPTAASSAQMPAFEETVTLTALAARGRALVLRAGEPRRAAGPAGRRSTAAMMLGLRDYVRQEPLPRRHARAFGRHRLRALGGGRGRCAGAGAGARGHDAVALHQPRKPGGRRGRARGCSASACDTISDRAGDGGLRRHAGAESSPAGSADITEENIQCARPRPDPDGDLQQVRPHGADHRQQVARCRSATPRSTATCAAATRC